MDKKLIFPWGKKYIHSTLTSCGNNNMAVVVYTVIHQMGGTRPQRVMVRLKNIQLYLPHIFFTFLLENCRILQTFFYLFQSYIYQKIQYP
jgi:hypothetical protein